MCLIGKAAAGVPAARAWRAEEPDGRVDAHGADFQEKAYTENVSLSGFFCSCVTALRMNSEVEVYLMEPADSTLERPMQSARNRR